MLLHLEQEKDAENCLKALKEDNINSEEFDYLQ